MYGLKLSACLASNKGLGGAGEVATSRLAMRREDGREELTRNVSKEMRKMKALTAKKLNNWKIHS